jgi:hypothetical protein
LIALTAPFSLPLLGKACIVLIPGATEPLFAAGSDNLDRRLAACATMGSPEPLLDRRLAACATVRALAVVCAASWALLAIAGGLLVWRSRLLSGRSVGRGPTWDCGYAAGNRRMQYTASSFASPLAILFRGVLRQRVELQEPAGIFPPRAGFRSETPDLFHTYLFRPVFLAVVWGSAKLRWLQRGRIQLYVLYIAVTVLSLLIWKLG